MDALSIELLQKKLEKEINDVLKQMALQVDKMEFKYKDKLALVINLKTILP